MIEGCQQSDVDNVEGVPSLSGGKPPFPTGKLGLVESIHLRCAKFAGWEGRFTPAQVGPALQLHYQPFSRLS